MAALQDVQLLHQAETKKFKSILEKQGVVGLQREIKKRLETRNNTNINIAVTGVSGAGKSTLINAILGLDDDSEEVAPTGVTETTVKISKYGKKNSKVIFWDLPGVGTPNFPRETYKQVTQLEKYDFFILVSRSRFTENDVWLAEQIQALGKKYFFVRSHVGQDIRNYRKAHPTSGDPEKELGHIRTYCEERLESLGQGTIKIYLIDSYMLEQYDFNKLVASFVSNTDEVKADILITNLASVSQEIIDMKCRGLLSRIRYVAIQAGMECTPNTAEQVMKDVFDHESKYYREVFEIDDDTLETQQELSLLKGLETFMQRKFLEKLSEGFIQSRVKPVSEAIRHFKKNVMSEIDDLKISQRSFIKEIFDILFMYMQCVHHFACSIYQNVPIEYAQACAAQPNVKKSII